MNRSNTLKLFITAAFALLGLTSIIAQNFPDFGYQPPSDWTGPTFTLSQEYPQTVPAKESLPWESIDFRTEPERYLWAVLNYGFEGNVEVDFEIERNTKRQWFHAPWLHYGANQREFVRGLTRERSSRPFELAATQDQTYRNFAVGFYDARGGFTIGRVWKDPKNPDASRANFPEGTMTFKLLFTTAPASTVPYLAGSPEWMADIDKTGTSPDILSKRVRLLQIDVAVKDKRSSKGGWVFGTFHYDSSIVDSNPWRRVRALALMWGDDPTHTPEDYLAGRRPVESWVNSTSPIVRYRANPPSGVIAPSTLGWAGRANGPVDNPVSSCISCHATAQLPPNSNMIPIPDMSNPDKLRWFRNTKPMEPFDTDSTSLDFSLQLGVGIRNHLEYHQSIKNFGGFFSHKSVSKPSKVEKASPAKKEFLFTRDPE